MNSGFFKALGGFILGMMFISMIDIIISNSECISNSGRCINVEVVEGKYISTIEFATTHGFTNQTMKKIKVVGIYEIGSIVEVVPHCDTIPTNMEIPSPDEINVINGTGTKK